MANGIGRKQSNMKTFDEGEYRVTFDEWFPLDDRGMPVLSTQARFGKDTLVARYRTTVEGEEDGPPGSLDPLRELSLFVKAMGGGDVPPLTPQNYDEIPRLLVQLAPQLTTPATVLVNNSGWITRIEGMSVPEGSKIVRFLGLTTFNDEKVPSWIQGTYGPICFGELEVLAGDFKGSVVKFLLPYPLEVDEETHNPCLVQISGGKRDGELTKASQRWLRFHETFVGPIKDFSVDAVADVYNICPEVEALAIAANRPATVVIMENGMANVETFANIPEGMEFNMPEPNTSVVQSQPGTTPDTPPPGMPQADSEERLSVVRVALRSIISNECEVLHQKLVVGEEKFEEGSLEAEVASIPASDVAPAWVHDDINSWELTAAGKLWAKSHLVPVIRECGYGKKFAEYTVEQIERIAIGLGYEDLVKTPSVVAEKSDDF